MCFLTVDGICRARNFGRRVGGVFSLLADVAGRYAGGACLALALAAAGFVQLIAARRSVR